jgi:hypothetical protein
MAKANVKCKVCGEIFDRNAEKAVAVGGRRYAHAQCAEGYEPVQEEQDIAKLHAYLKDLFKSGYNYQVLNRQIETYIKTGDYTYSGILKTLIYWYDIKKNSLEKSNNRIGIVPYVYDEAREYYYNLYLANEINKDKDLTKYKEPEVIEVKIKPPMRKFVLRLFNLDD